MRLIDADALIKEYCDGCEFSREGVCDCEPCGKVCWVSEAPTIDPESLRSQGRCRYCSKDDGSGLEWDCDDIEVSVTLRCGVLTICNQYGDEAEMPIKYCPICGARMKGAGN